MSGEGLPELQLGEAGDLRLAIVAGSWHAEISEALIAGAQRVAAEANVKNVTLVRSPVPSSFRWWRRPWPARTTPSSRSVS